MATLASSELVIVVVAAAAVDDDDLNRVPVKHSVMHSVGPLQPISRCSGVAKPFAVRCNEDFVASPPLQHARLCIPLHPLRVTQKDSPPKYSETVIVVPPAANSV